MERSRSELIEAIADSERWFPRSFAEAVTREWGVLFHTPSIPESHDGNHARVADHGGRPADAVREVVAFYRSKGLTPRVNFVSADGDDPQLRAALSDAGFVFEYENEMRVYVHEGPSSISPNPAVRVRRVSALSSTLFDAISELNCLRVARVLKRRMCQREAHLFVGEYEGRSVSIALLEPAERLWRVDEVHTHPDFRGRGCARAVIHELVSFERGTKDTPLYLWTDNPVAERLYVEAGFESVGQPLTSWCSWLPD